MEKAGVKREELLFFIALHIYLFDTFLELSVYDYMWSRPVIQGIKYSMMLFLLLKWLLFERYNFKKVCIWAVTLLLTLILMYKGHYTTLLLAVSLFLSSEGIDFRRILRQVLIGEVCCIAFIMLSCAAGILPDYTFSHEAMSVGAVAHSYGFKYYSTWGDSVMALTVIWSYLRGKKCGWLEICILFLLNTMLYRLHTTGLAYYAAVFYLILFVLIEKAHLSFRHHIFRVIGMLLPWILFGLTWGLVKLYEADRFALQGGRFATLMSRLRYSSQAVKLYGIHLFGNDVKMFGNTQKVYGTAQTGFYIDSGYVYLPLAYGILFTVALLLLYSLLIRFICMRRDDLLYAWILVFLFMNIINNFSIDIPNNPILLLMAGAVAAAPSLPALNLGARGVRRRHSRYRMWQEKGEP